MTSKNIIVSLKRHNFQKHHLFNKSKQHSMEILHDHMFLYIDCAIGKRNNFATLLLKNHVLLKNIIS